MLTEWIRPMVVRVAMGLALVGATSTQVAAQSNGDIAEACVQAVRAVAAEASEDLRSISARTVQEIRQLAGDGASDAEIVQAGREGIERINRRAGAASQRVRHLVETCVGELQDNDAPAILIARVREAGRNARELIETSRDRSVTRVQRAMRATISP